MVEGGGGEPISLGSVLTDSLKSGGIGQESLSNRSESSSLSGLNILANNPTLERSGSPTANGNTQSLPPNPATAATTPGSPTKGSSSGSYGSSGYGSSSLRSTYDRKRRRRRKLPFRRVNDKDDVTNRRHVRTGISVPRLVGVCRSFLYVLFVSQRF